MRYRLRTLLIVFVLGSAVLVAVRLHPFVFVWLAMTTMIASILWVALILLAVLFFGLLHATNYVRGKFNRLDAKREAFSRWAALYRIPQERPSPDPNE